MIGNARIKLNLINLNKAFDLLLLLCELLKLGMAN